MKTITLFLIMVLPLQAMASDNPKFKSDVWMVQFYYSDGWGLSNNIWISSTGKAGYGNMGNMPSLPCQYELSQENKSQIISKITDAIIAYKGNPNFGKEKYLCSDETRVSVSISHHPKDNGVLGFVSRMSMSSRCNDFNFNQNLFEAAKIAYNTISELPSHCNINPLKQ